MNRIGDVLEVMERLAPPDFALEGDNIGLLIGDREAPVRKALLSLDADDRAVAGAAEEGYGLLLTHHPLLFHPLFRLTKEDAAARRALTLWESGTALISMHTNLDAAFGGVNDALAAALGLSGVGEFPNADARPGIPSIGRIGRIPPEEGESFVRRTVESLRASGARFVLSGRPCEKIAVAGGSCADYLADAHAAGCDTLVTSECKYRHFTLARDLGMNLIDAGHYATEAAVLWPLKACLEKELPDITFDIVREEGDPVRVYERRGK